MATTAHLLLLFIYVVFGYDSKYNKRARKGVIVTSDGGFEEPLDFSLSGLVGVTVILTQLEALLLHPALIYIALPGLK